jgi:hypothetical protein
LAPQIARIVERDALPSLDAVRVTAGAEPLDAAARDHVAFMPSEAGTQSVVVKSLPGGCLAMASRLF